MTIAERVQNGIDFLDEHEPGWMDKINVENLDIASAHVCVLGQVCGDYGMGARKHSLDLLHRFDMGFTHFDTIVLIRLTIEWKRRIVERRVDKGIANLNLEPEPCT